MFLLAHLTDPHLGPLPAIRRRDLASKRLFGYVNWQRNRVHAFDEGMLAALTDDIRAHQPDHIAVTGDLVNLALADELAAAHTWLKTLGDPHDVTVIPGNHDAYVSGALSELIKIWRDFMSDDDDEPGEFARFPFVRRRGPVAIVGLSSAIATMPLMATGHIAADQATSLGERLAKLKDEGCFRVVLIHHPPTSALSGWSRRLVGAGLFRAEIARHGAELVLHGHNHRLMVSQLAGPHGGVPVVGGAAASVSPGERRTGGSYNLFRIEASKGGFTCTMTERGIRSVGGKVETLSEHTLISEPSSSR
jgi:3',5'-cyclic AMP phosphodiesterase CpdA